jgi:thiamine transporter ThiT
MNAMVTSYQLVYLYSPAGEEGEPPKCAYWLIGGQASAVNILFILITISGKVFFGTSAFQNLRII